MLHAACATGDPYGQEFWWCFIVCVWPGFKVSLNILMAFYNTGELHHVHPAIAVRVELLQQRIHLAVIQSHAQVPQPLAQLRTVQPATAICAQPSHHLEHVLFSSMQISNQPVERLLDAAFQHTIRRRTCAMHVRTRSVHSGGHAAASGAQEDKACFSCFFSYSV